MIYGQLELVVDERQAGDGVVCDVGYDSGLGRKRRSRDRRVRAVALSGFETKIVIIRSPQVQPDLTSPRS